MIFRGICRLPLVLADLAVAITLIWYEGFALIIIWHQYVICVTKFNNRIAKIEIKSVEEIDDGTDSRSFAAPA